MEIFDNSFIQIITIIVAIFGGLPGIIGLVRAFQNQAKFIVNLQSTVYFGGTNKNGREYQGIICFVFLTNKGIKDYCVVHYGLTS